MYAFIVGSPRSGTTLLANLLGRHPSIGIRYEPYYVWERYFWDRPDDVLTAADATDKVTRFIKKSFDRYRVKTGYQILIDKSPRSSLRIPFINKIFPEAKWIHIVRDGRDATLSIYKRWQLMDEIATDKSLSGSGWAYLADRLSYEPFWTDKLRFLWHETRPLLKHGQLLSRLRWEGDTGWGPRFYGYQQELKIRNRLEFCACQWLACINAVETDIAACGLSNITTVSYEDLIKDGPGTMKKLLTFLECRFSERDYVDVKLKSDNTQKWKNEFSEKEQVLLLARLMPKLKELGYE